MRVIKVFFTIFLFILVIPEKSYTAEKKEKDIGFGGRDDFSHLKTKNSDFKKGKDALKQAQKFKKKSKNKKAVNRYNDAIEYFVSAYKDYPDSTEVLNYLAFTYSEVGDLMMAEIYYQESLEINPKNNSIHEKLGKNIL